MLIQIIANHIPPQTKEPSTNMPLEEPRPSLSPVSVPQTSPAKPTWECPFASRRKPRDSASQSSQSNLPHPYQITADGSGLQPTSSSQQLEQLCELHEQRQALKPSPDKSGVARSCVEDPLQSESGQEGFCIVAEAARRSEKDTMMRNMSEIALYVGKASVVGILRDTTSVVGSNFYETAPTYWSYCSIPVPKLCIIITNRKH